MSSAKEHPTRPPELSEEDQLMETIRYGMESVSQVGTEHSRPAGMTSNASSASSARLRAAAEKASLEAQAAAERKKQALEEEELLLEMKRKESQLKFRKRRRQIELETKISMAEAMEKTFAEAEAEPEWSTCSPLHTLDTRCNHQQQCCSSHGVQASREHT